MNKKEMFGYVFFGAVFFIEAAVTALKIKLPELPPLAFLLALGLAAYRGGRAVSFNGIFSWLRHLAGLRDEPDSSGAGDSAVIPDEIQGFRRVLAGLIECPICSGTWVTVGLLVIYALYPSMGLVMIYVLAAAGIGEFLHWGSEYTAWKGREARESSGSYWLAKNKPPKEVMVRIAPEVRSFTPVVSEDGEVDMLFASFAEQGRETE